MPIDMGRVLQIYRESSEFRQFVYACVLFAVGAGLMLAVLVRMRKRPRINASCLQRCWGVMLSFLLILVAIAFFLRGIDQRWKRQTPMTLLAAAINVYHDEYGVLPDSLEPVVNTGLLGLKSFKAVSDGDMEVDGVRMHYIRATEPGFIVVVETQPAWRRGYIILGDMSSHHVSQSELQKILVDDERRRIEAGQPQGWVKWYCPYRK